MSGTLPNLPLSMQFDKDTSLPLRGGKLYFFQAGTIATPQNAFQDTGLTIALPNPITLDGGRVPSFYLADGSIHVRLTNAAGVIQFDEMNLLVIGPSSGGGGGGGGGIDPTAIFQTGDVMWTDNSGARAGWVRDNGRTIGSAVSGAVERANADCQNLFTFIWQTYSNPSANAVCPVIGGIGASAAADWAANKGITLPDKRGFAPAGLDGMGSSLANRYAGVPIVSGGFDVPGSICGEATHTLSLVETPSVGPNYVRSTPTFDWGTNIIDYAAGLNNAVVFTANPSFTTTQTVNTGGDNAHNNTDRRVLGTFYRKL